MYRDEPGALEQARVDAGLTQGELWLRYFGLGGMTPTLELEAIVLDALVPTAADRDKIAHALNERFTEQGGDHPVQYSS